MLQNCSRHKVSRYFVIWRLWLSGNRMWVSWFSTAVAWHHAQKTWWHGKWSRCEKAQARTRERSWNFDHRDSERRYKSSESWTHWHLLKRSFSLPSSTARRWVQRHAHLFEGREGGHRRLAAVGETPPRPGLGWLTAFSEGSPFRAQLRVAKRGWTSNGEKRKSAQRGCSLGGSKCWSKNPLRKTLSQAG